MADKKRSKISNIAVYVIIGILAVSLIGFGPGQFGGSVERVASVGKSDVSLQRFIMHLQNERQRQSNLTGQEVTFAELNRIGIDRAVLSQLIGVVALEDEARRLGLSIGDARLGEIIQAQPQFKNFGGQLDRASYKEILSYNGLTIKEFEDQLRVETAARLVAEALQGLARPNATFGRTISAAWNERRSFEWVALRLSDLPTPLSEPTAEELEAFYTENSDLYTEPETRQISYVALEPADLMDLESISQTALRGIYDDRIAEYEQPEQRMVERLLFANMAQAEQAAAALSEGRSDFESLVAGEGLELQDIDLGLVNEAMLGDAGAKVFALAEPGLTSPIKTELGPAIFRINAILPSVSVAFEEVEEELRQELALEQAAADIAVQLEDYNDLLASGITLEDLALETPLVLKEVSIPGELGDGITADPNFIKMAMAVDEASYPEFAFLEDGGIFALRLDTLNGPRLKPQAEVRAQLLRDWQAKSESDMLKAFGGELVGKIAEGQDFNAFGLATANANTLLRTDFAETNLPQPLFETAFALQPGQAQIAVDGSEIYLVRLSAIHPADPNSENFTQLQSVADDLMRQGLAMDIMETYQNALVGERQIKIDQRALSAVAAQ